MIRKLSSDYVLAHSGFLMRCCPMAESLFILELEFLHIRGGCSLTKVFSVLMLVGTCCFILSARTAVSSKFENQINKAITSCFYAVKPCVVYNAKVILPSAKKDSVPTTQKSCVVYEFSCRCEARYVGRTTQRLANRIKQHVPTSIRTKTL